VIKRLADQAPEEVFEHTIDWSDALAKHGVGDTISTVTWEDIPAGLTKDSESNTTTTSTIVLSINGNVGDEFIFTCRIETTLSRTDDQRVRITIRRETLNFGCQDPDEVFDHIVNWLPELTNSGSDTIATATWEDIPSGMSIDTPANTTTTHTGWITISGANGSEYTFTSKVITAASRTFYQRCKLKVKS
jgi:hypothetical protein